MRLMTYNILHYAPAQPGESWLPRRRVRHELPGGGLDTRAVSVLESCGLVDVFHAAHDTPPTALTRSCPDWHSYQVRLDYVFATRAAAAGVTRTERVDGALADTASDHYALYADVQI